MKGYWYNVKNMFMNESISLVLFIMGFLMFGASVGQLGDPSNKVDPAITHPALMAWGCTIIGMLTMIVSAVKRWLILRNFISGYAFFLSCYILIDLWENIDKSANGVWIIAFCIYLGLFVRSYKDLLEHKNRGKCKS